MVRVNGKKFKIYELDNLFSFQSRLANIMGTEESFLYFPNGITTEEIYDKKSNIIVEDLLSEIKQSAKNNSSVITLVKNIQTKVGKNRYERGKDIVNIWLAYNKKLKNDVEQQGKTPLNVIGEDLEKNKIFISRSQIHISWKQIDTVKKYIKTRIANNSDTVDKDVKIFQEYKDAEEVAYTDLDVEEIHFVLSLNLDKLSLMEMFNAIQLNDMVPYATINKFYKILQDFIPPEEWSDSVNDVLMIRVHQKDYMSTSGIASNYGKAEVQINPVTREVISRIVIKNEKNNISRDVFTDRSLSVFKNLDIKVTKISESKVVGVFFMPALQFNKYVFSELVLNDELFSRLIKIDDRKKATKMKTGIYIHFYHPTTGHIKATLTEKLMEKGDSTMKNVDAEMFEIGVPYIRVKIKNAQDTRSVEIFQTVIGKLFAIYENKKDGIIEYYKNYIPDFGNIIPLEEEDEQVELVHKKIDPELFASGYTISCNPYRMPTIVTEENALKSKQPYMKFPRDRQEDPEVLSLPRDGENQHHYICKNPAYPFPGLKDNNLDNSDIFPYVPCCFKKDQSKKPKYMHYYEGKELTSIEKKQNNIITTDKSLKYNQFGTLPENISRLFTIIDPNPDYEYVRKGVYDNKNSFINVVMEALNDETNILDIEGDEARNDVLIEERKALATKSNASLCRQEMYDSTTEEIIDLINDTNTYFDPKLFLHVLEDRFDCNIFLFTKRFVGGEMTLPRHVQAYYKNRNKKRCIYVYEHMRNEYPKCELIVKYNTKKSHNNSQYSFTYKEARNVRNVFTRLRKSYALNSVIKETYFPLNKSVKIKSQLIDSYGKTRRFDVLYNNQAISMITSPMQPLKIRETSNKDVTLIDVDTAIKFSKDINMTVQSQTVIGYTVKEINGIVGNVSVTIPVIDSEKIHGIPEQYSLTFAENHPSSLDKYNTNKKLARYLTEYTLWVYSNYLNDNGISTITDNNIAQFAKDFFVIKPDYVYGKIGKTFSKQSTVLDGGKIIIHTDEIIKRLLYVLRWSVQRDVNSVMMYYENTVIKNYYVDITDFDKYHGQVILYGEESIEKWISENNLSYTTNNQVKIGVNTPYFFKNSLIDNNMYLAQNSQTLEKAIDIAVNWVRSGHNIGMYAKDMTPVEFTLYSYVNENDIKPARKIKGKAFSDEIKIIGYKIDNDPKYTVLLSIV